MNRSTVLACMASICYSARMAKDKYDWLTSQHRGFRRGFRARIERGDSNNDIAFWIRTKYGLSVSDEAVRQWRSRLTDAA